MMVNEGDADAMISGYSRAYPVVIRPVLETIGKFEGVNKIATTNLMLTKRGAFVYFGYIYKYRSNREKN